MKRLHRADLWGWSTFDPARNLDFHSVLWQGPAGNVAVDPLPLSEHDRAHLAELGGLSKIVVTNSDHLRDAIRLRQELGAELCGPRAEKDALSCDRWLGEGDEVVAGLSIIELGGSKTPGELALLLTAQLEGSGPQEPKSTLITGDLIRCHQAGRLHLLPDAKLADRAAALASLRRLVDRTDIDAVLVGDGWPIFREGHRALAELAARS
jgi:hypothetical protein